MDNKDNKKVNVDVMKNIEKIKDRALATTIERNSFLGEYKERVLAALTFDEIEEKGTYNEIEKALEDKEAKKMIVSREADFKAMGNKICKFHSDIIEKEIPEYRNYYGKIEFMDSLFGTKCPICQKLGGKKRG